MIWALVRAVRRDRPAGRRRGPYPVGPGVVERGVKLGQAARELRSPRRGSCSRLLALPFMLGQRGEPFLQLCFAGGCLLQGLLGQDSAGLGRGYLLLVFASPRTAPALVQGSPHAPQRLFGLLSCPEGTGKLAAGIVSLGSPVYRDPGLEVPQVAGRCGPGVAEPVDPEGERVVCLHAGSHYLGPVVVQLVPEVGDVVPAPSLGRLEPVGCLLLPEETGRAAGEVVTVGLGSSSPLGIGSQLGLQRATLLPSPSGQPGQST